VRQRACTCRGRSHDSPLSRIPCVCTGLRAASRPRVASVHLAQLPLASVGPRHAPIGTADAPSRESRRWSKFMLNDCATCRKLADAEVH
jgi:hypothetical protein